MSSILTNSISGINADAKMAYVPIERRAVGAHDIHIKVAYSGICHSDIHTVKGEWGPQTYPQCVGHEIIGTVVSVGADVKDFKAGDKAGVGCFVNSCRSCEECKNGDENYCSGSGATSTYSGKCAEAFQKTGITQGGYSGDIVVDANYALHVPDNLFNKGGAPLLCAGVTCYDPFVYYGLKAGEKLGVVGLGGLGHLAVKIGVAMGAIVTVISTSAAKREQALAMGATNFVVSTDAADMKSNAKSLTMIYDSIAFNHDYNALLGLLKSSGTLIVVGGIPENMNIASFSILARRLKVVGSCIGGIKSTQNTLDFCSRHNIVSESELIPANPEAVEVAYRRAIAGDVRFRFVIDTGATLPPPSSQ